VIVGRVAGDRGQGRDWSWAGLRLHHGMITITSWHGCSHNAVS